MDLSVTDENKIEYIKRAELMRPLGKLKTISEIF
jgi:hypothetical protein